MPRPSRTRCGWSVSILSRTGSGPDGLGQAPVSDHLRAASAQTLPQDLRGTRGTKVADLTGHVADTYHLALGEDGNTLAATAEGTTLSDPRAT